jgi:23S rRNA (cytidine2498-2'-O)-methyltransferase
MVSRERPPLVAASPEGGKDGSSIESLGGTIYLAPEGFEAELRAELGRDAAPVAPDSRLFFAPGARRASAWAADVWLDPVRVRFGSITDAAKALRSLGGTWSLFPTSHHRRAALISEQLPQADTRPLVFPAPPSSAPRGAFTLLSANEILAAARCTSPFPNGEARFVEDHVRPPSRAYLKLWEAFTLVGRRPPPGARCVDLGSSPGGWTWVIERLGARVISVDKAPIAPALMKLTRVRYVKDSAFALDPASVGRVDWMLSDVICYPSRSAALIERWLVAHPHASFVVTIKLQGETDTSAVRALERVPGARLVHLHHNRHELTWIRVAPEPE